jgi:O-antigen/teichoic acid export membrane protein
VLFAAVVQGVFYLRNVLLLPLLTRVLGAELFGAWVKMQGLANLVTPLLGAGAILGFTRFAPSVAADDRGRYFWSAVLGIAVTGGLVAVGIAALGPVIRPQVYQAAPASLTVCMLLALGILPLVSVLGQITASYYQLTDRPHTYGTAILGQVGLLLAGAVLLAWWWGRTLWVPLVAWLCGPVLAVAWLLARIRRETRGQADWRSLGEMVRFGAPLLPMSMMMWVVDSADRYLLTWLVPEGADAVVGVYSASYSLGGLVAMVFGPFFLFYTPAVTRLWDAGNLPEVGRLTRTMVKCGLLLALPVTAVGVTYGDLITRCVAGASFRGDPVVVGLVMAGYCLYMVGSYAQMPLLMEKRTGTILVIGVATAAVNVALGYLLIPLADPWGRMRGAALATTCSFGLFLLLSRVAVRGRRGFSLGGVHLVSLTGLAGLAGACLNWGHDRGAAAAVLTAVLAAALYGGGILVTRVITPAEMSVVRNSLLPWWTAWRRGRVG